MVIPRGIEPLLPG